MISARTLTRLSRGKTGFPLFRIVLLLSVIGQNLVAGPAEPAAVLFQTTQHDHVAVVHLGATEAHYVARAGIVTLLRERLRRCQGLRGSKCNQKHK
ncbi:MAG TPA: hypothetical protein VGF62_05965 [Rhizomicrobium sp.]|jgi:hypothetical protein